MIKIPFKKDIDNPNVYTPGKPLYNQDGNLIEYKQYWLAKTELPFILKYEKEIWFVNTNDDYSPNIETLKDLTIYPDFEYVYVDSSDVKVNTVNLKQKSIFRSLFKKKNARI